MRILLVEDNRDILANMADYLQMLQAHSPLRQTREPQP